MSVPNKRQRTGSVLAAKSAAASSSVDLEERIRMRAFEIYQMRIRQGRPGDALSDWLQAEQELRQAASRR